jgi:hypothetical protein
LKFKPDPLLIDLLSKILVYPPKDRLKPLEVLNHAYFNDLRNENFKVTNGGNFPDFFDFTKGAKLNNFYILR